MHPDLMRTAGTGDEAEVRGDFAKPFDHAVFRGRRLGSRGAG